MAYITNKLRKQCYECKYCQTIKEHLENCVLLEGINLDENPHQIMLQVLSKRKKLKEIK